MQIGLIGREDTLDRSGKMCAVGRGHQGGVLLAGDTRGAKSPTSEYLPEVPRSVTFQAITLGMGCGRLSTLCAGEATPREAPEKPEEGSGTIGGIGALSLGQGDLGCLEEGDQDTVRESCVSHTNQSQRDNNSKHLRRSAPHDSTCSTQTTSPVFTRSS